MLHKDKLSEPFEVHSGVRQGCILSPDFRGGTDMDIENRIKKARAAHQKFEHHVQHPYSSTDTILDLKSRNLMLVLKFLQGPAGIVDALRPLEA